MPEQPAVCWKERYKDRRGFLLLCLSGPIEAKQNIFKAVRCWRERRQRQVKLAAERMKLKSRLQARFSVSDTISENAQTEM